MDAGRIFAAAISVILIGTTSSPRSLGQTAPGAEPSLTHRSDDSQPLVTEPTDSSQVASCCDLTFGQSCCSRWTASADFIILERIGTAAYTLVSLVPHNKDPLTTIGTEVLNATDLHQGFSGGPQLGLTHHGDDGSDLEVSYFQIDGWDNARTIGPILAPDGHEHEWLVMRAPGNFVQAQNDRHTQSMTWDYSSQLYNAEVNLRRSPWRRVTVLAGFRWVNLSEQLEGILLPPTQYGTGSFWYSQTKNNLYGLPPPAYAEFFCLLHRADQQAKLNAQQLHVAELDPNVPGDHQPGIEHSLKDVCQTIPVSGSGDELCLGHEVIPFP